MSTYTVNRAKSTLLESVSIGEKLFSLAESINKSWEEMERVDWSEAEQLVTNLKKLPASVIHQCGNGLSRILKYSDQHDEWDCEYVASWPTKILNGLELPDGVYTYWASGDNWDIYSVKLNGEKEWKATVETETMAETFVKSLEGISEFSLQSHEPESPEEVKVIANGRGGPGLELMFDGYSNCCSEDDDGCLLYIEYYDSELFVRVYGDINSEEPTAVINLETARNGAREEV